MNALLNSELANAAPGTLKSVETLLIPFNRLILSANNVRQSAVSGINELAAMIYSQGLLSALQVTKVSDGSGRYAVEAGGRRWRALKLLVEQGKMSDDGLIECRVVDIDDALEVSLAENVSQQPMHPADEYVAYAALVDQGRSMEDVAKRFGVKESHVQRRMKMASVAPELLTLYRADAMTLDQLMALAASDSRVHQVEVWNSLPQYGRSAFQIKAKLFQGEVREDDPRVTIVGMADYLAAGGRMRVDLFSQDDAAFLSDPVLIDRLIGDKVQIIKQELLDDGWSWVEFSMEHVYDHTLRSKYTMLRPTPREPNDAEKVSLAALDAAMLEIENKLNEATQTDDENQVEILQEELSRKDDERDVLAASFVDEPAYDKANQGVVFFIGNEGFEYFYGLSRLSSAPKASPEEKKKEKESNADLPERLTANLTSHLTAATQISLIDQPDVALALLASRMAISLFARNRYIPFPLEVKIDRREYSMKEASDTVEASKAFVATQDALSKWATLLPQQPQDMLAWFLSQPQSVSIDMIVLGTAVSTDASQTDSKKENKAANLIRALKLDMADYWEATPETFLNFVPKAKMISAVTAAVGEATAKPMESMKKTDVIAYATAKLKGMRWLPDCLKF